MENNDVVIKMIPLNNFIDVLVDLYNKGVDYIDIMGVVGEQQDKMAISFTEDYMCESAKENFKDIPQVDISGDSKLSDEDLNKLI